MARYDYDLFVIGAGSGGVRAARVSAEKGARVAVAEERYLGGTCVNVGCVPKKLFYYASHYRAELRDARGFGWRVGDFAFDWQTLRDRKDQEIDRLQTVYGSLLERAGVDVFEAHARLIDSHTLEVASRRLTAENILVAVGSWPFLPEVPGIEHAITSNEAFHFDRLPRRVLIAGGGYVAVEFAGILHGFGVETELCYRGELFLRGFDAEIRRALADEMRGQGHRLHFESHIASIERRSSGLEVALDTGLSVEVDAVLMATGRRPKTDELGLEALGVKLNDRGEIRVDAYSQSSVPSIWAIGDVTDRGFNLTPVAIREGMALAETLFGRGPTKPDLEHVPTAIFSQPPIGTVGLSEEEARQRYGAVEIYRSRFRPLKLTLTENGERTLVKLVVDSGSRRVLGAHMIGDGAGEIIQGLAIAIKMGATKEQFDTTLGVHPTTAEEFVTLRSSS